MTSSEIPQIYTAARNGDCLVLQKLLDEGVSVSSSNPQGWTPLHAATYYGRLEAVKILLRAGAPLEAEIPPEGWQPIHKACERNFVEIVRLLIEHGADREAKTKQKLTPLHIAAGNGRVNVVKYLLEIGVQLEPQSETRERPLHRAARIGSKEVVNQLLQAGSTVDVQNDAKATPLIVAAKAGHAEIVRCLLNHKADLSYKNDYGWTALHFSSYYGQVAATRALLEPAPWLEDEVYADGYRPLHMAVENGNLELIRMLLDAGALINARTANGQTPLYVAVRLKHPDVAKELLRLKADMNTPKDTGWTPLHVAVDTGNESMVRLLLAHGCDTTRVDKTGQTALSLAKAQGKWQIVDILSPPDPSAYLEIEEVNVASNTSSEPKKVSARAAAVASDMWFENLNKFRRPFLNRDTSSQSSRPRIAIIDSGVDPQHPHIGQIYGYKDFVTETEIKQDVTGHGSTGVDLICKVIEDPEIYVARVFERATGSLQEQEYTAKAIEHARDVWKVDIITLASGFNVKNQNMEQEISKCMTSDVLLFAAAGNEANVGFIKFPASLDTVICMFATSANGKPLTNSVNPAADKKRFYNFAIFGENVVSRPGGRPQSGTSMSTFIGAAVAGFVLKICQQLDVRHIIGEDLLADLRRIRGMSAILEKMAEGGLEAYHCICPWKICSSLPRPFDEERKFIAYAIMIALDSDLKR